MTKSNKSSKTGWENDEEDIFSNGMSRNNKAPSLISVTGGMSMDRNDLKNQIIKNSSGEISSKYAKGKKKFQIHDSQGSQEWIDQGSKGKTIPKSRKQNSNKNKPSQSNQNLKSLFQSKTKQTTNNDDNNESHSTGKFVMQTAGVDGYNTKVNGQRKKKRSAKYDTSSDSGDEFYDNTMYVRNRDRDRRRNTTGGMMNKNHNPFNPIDAFMKYDDVYDPMERPKSTSRGRNKKSKQQEVVDLVDSEEEDLMTPSNDNGRSTSSSITAQKVLTSSLWETKSQKMEECGNTQNHIFQNMKFVALGLFFGTKQLCSYDDKKSYRVEMSTTDATFTIMKNYESAQPLDAIFAQDKKVEVKFSNVNKIYICRETFPRPFIALWVDNNVDLNSVAEMGVDLKPDSENTTDDPSKYILVLTTEESVIDFWNTVKAHTKVEIHDVSDDKGLMCYISKAAYRDTANSTTSSGTRKSSRNRRRTSTSIYLDGGIIDPTDRETILIYPMEEEALDAVTITRGDQKRCQYGQYWNDNLIDLRIKLLVEEMPDISSKKVHVFSCHFFSVLSDHKGAHDSVKRWTKNIDVFELDYIFVPVNANEHWSLAVIIRPGLLVKHLEKFKYLKKRSTKLEDSDDEDQSIDINGTKKLNWHSRDKSSIYKNLSINENENLSCIIHLDSLGAMHNSDRINRILSTYLDAEWASRKKEDTENNTIYTPNCDVLNVDRLFTTAGIHKIKVSRVPRQENGWDCGVFVTEYVKMLLDNNPTSNTEDVRTKFSDQVEYRFDQSEIQKVRTKMKTRIDSLASQYKQELEHRKIEEKRKKEEDKLDKGSGNYSCDTITTTTKKSSDSSTQKSNNIGSTSTNTSKNENEKEMEMNENKEDSNEDFPSQATSSQNQDDEKTEADTVYKNLKIYSDAGDAMDAMDVDEGNDGEKDREDGRPNIFAENHLNSI